MKTIMIVDDEAYIRQSFGDYFDDRGWRILQADSAEQALCILEEATPDAIVVDIRLSGMNGTAFIRKVYKDMPQTVFVVCTGSPEFAIPSDLLKINNISKQVCIKPVTNMVVFESKIVALMSKIAD